METAASDSRRRECTAQGGDEVHRLDEAGACLSSSRCAPDEPPPRPDPDPNPNPTLTRTWPRIHTLLPLSLSIPS